MWRFWRRSAVEPVPARVRHLLARERGVSADGSAALRMLTRRGHDADRPVTSFRVFDPAVLARNGVEPRRFADLGTGLFVHAGPIERDGAIVLTWQPPAT
jgi:hypothetical protein